MVNEQQAHEAVVDEVFKVAPPVGCLTDLQTSSIDKEGN